MRMPKQLNRLPTIHTHTRTLITIKKGKQRQLNHYSCRLRPITSAPVLYEVASHVKKLPFRPLLLFHRPYLSQKCPKARLDFPVSHISRDEHKTPDRLTTPPNTPNNQSSRRPTHRCCGNRCGNYSPEARHLSPVVYDMN